MRHQYSDKEFQMFAQLGFSYLVETTLEPAATYRTVALEVFCRNQQGAAVESLRRCMQAWCNNTCHRMATEWDAMISLD